jgi:site-specific recombinase XerD
MHLLENGVNIRVVQELMGHCQNHRDLHACHGKGYFSRFKPA